MKFNTPDFKFNLQGVSEIRVLILTGNRTRQRNNFSIYHFAEKRRLIPKKKLERFFTKIALRH
jgi:hypothetical protein